MPFISKEEVKEKRNAIRKMFPEYKISVTGGNSSSINVDILSGPVNLLEGSNEDYVQVNTYYIDRHYEEQPESLKVLSKIQEIINKNNYTQHVDADYGAIPDFYVRMNIGNWDKPYQVTIL